MIPLLCLVPIALLHHVTPENQIVLDPSMLYAESGFGDLSTLVDEQGANKDNPPTKPFFPGWTAWNYPISVAIDLGGKCHVSKVAIYNDTGENPIVLSTGVPFAWKEHSVSLGGYKAWDDFALNADTRWLRLTLTRPTSISELFVYGSRLEKALPKPTPKKRRIPPTMDQFIGNNAFIDDPIDVIATSGGFVREYHPWGWDIEGANGQRRFQPSGAAGGNLWFFDDYYQKLKAAGATVSPVVWQAPDPLFDYKSKESKPIKVGANSEDPASYRLHAEHFFQYAARYGSKPVADSLLSLASGQPRRSGLGYLQYLENWNEPDKTWEGREGRFNPYELAALSSADYDGDQGKMGKTVGVKNADPAMRLVLGGLAGLDLQFIRSIKLWSDYKRGGSFPADVINLHHYSSSSNEQWFQPGGKGISPEDDRLKDKLSAIADWRDANIPDRELWLTEFGYDTNPGSPLHAPALGSMSPEQVQAAWLIRSYLALAAARVDRAAMFMLRDSDPKAAGVFASCGLVGPKGDWTRKPSWFYVATLKKRLTGFRFAKILSQESDPVWLYEFTSAGGHRAIAAWCPTSADKRISNFVLRLEASHVKLLEFSPTDTKGTERTLAPSGGRVTFDVSETPKLLLVD